MIGRIEGVLLEKQAPYLLVDVQGVGYELQAPMTTFYALPEISHSVTLYTHFSVSENSQQLFGFIHRQDRDLFRIVIKINGVGPKMAIAILSTMTADELVKNIRGDHLAALVKVPGVGKKTAERLMIELRDKLASWSVTSDDLLSSGMTSFEAGSAPQTVRDESESALQALGYKPTEAARLVANALKVEPVARAEDVIRSALRSMVSG